MKCLVTGGAGFVGSHLVDRLVEEGYDVVIVDDLSLGKEEFINKKASFHKVDIRNFSELQPLFEGVDVVFHLAAEPRLPISIEDPIGTHGVNVTGTLHVLEAARLAGVGKVVFSSSCAVYGDCPRLPLQETEIPVPKSPYGLHKRIGEEYAMLYAELYGIPTVSLRYFNVFGPRKLADGGYPMVIPIFLKQRQEEKKMTVVGDGTNTRDYVHVTDVVDANIRAWKSDVPGGEIINIGSNRQVSVNDIAELIGGETEFLPSRSGEMEHARADNTKAKKLLGWEPTITLEEGVEELKKEWGL